MSDVLVSIITPTLNRAQFLAEAIDCVAKQTYRNIEHIVVDGGSVDETAQLLEAAAPRVIGQVLPGSSQAVALNAALGLARGEIVGWLNSDDLYYPDAVERAVAVAQQSPGLDLFYGDCDFIDEYGTVTRHRQSRPFGWRRLVWYDPAIFAIQAMFFRRRVVDRVGGFDPSLRYALDYDWLIRVGKACSVRYVPVTLGQFRRHEAATQGRIHRDAYDREVVSVSRRHGGAIISPLKWRLVHEVPGAGRLTQSLRPLRERLLQHRLLNWI